MHLLKSFIWSTPVFTPALDTSLAWLKKIAADGTNVAQRRLDRAHALASERQFGEAIALLQSIHPSAGVYAEAQKHLLEYREAHQFQTQQWFERAATQVGRNNFSEAVRLLRLIPQDARIYAQAQVKLAAYQQTIEQLHLRGGSSGIR